MEGYHTCEGIEHESATLVDGVAAGEQLILSTSHFAERDSASTQSKKQLKKKR